MTHPLIQNIAAELDVSVEEVNAVIAGERVPNDDNLYRIINTLGTGGHGVYVCAVWKGEPVPNALRNMPTYDFFGQILEALNLSLDKRGYTSRFMVSNIQLADYRYFEEVIGRHPNVGLIDIAADFTGDLQRVCTDYQQPLLYLDFPAPQNADGDATDQDAADQYIISINAQAIIEELVAHLYQLGHRRIGFIKGPQRKRSAIDRFNGYCTGLALVGLEYDEALVGAGIWHQPSGAAATEKLLALDSRPTAIIASSDLMALGAMQAIENHGLKIPADISVVGYDDIAAAQMANPPLTSVRMPMSAIGAKAGETIIDLLEGRLPEPRQVYFPLELVTRESVGPAPTHKTLLIDSGGFEI